MPANQLTPKQRRLLQELNEIAARLRLNYREIKGYDPAIRTTRLEVIREHLIRGEIVLAYTFIDENLNIILCNHFFGRKHNSIKLWKTKRFKNFNYFFLEKLSLMEKLAYVRAIKEIPRRIRNDVEQLNNLRNGVAHAFFPQNLRSAKPKWKGIDVFSIRGVEVLWNDLVGIDSYFKQRAFGG